MIFKAPRLRWIAAALLLAFPLILWWVATEAQDSGLQALKARGTDKLDLYRFSLKGELEKFEFLPRILAQNKDVIALLEHGAQGSRRLALDRYLERFNKITGASDTYIMDATGLTLVASNWDGPRPFVGQSFAFRPYFKQAMQGRAGRYFALGSTSLRRGFYFSYPVMQHGRVLGAAVIKVSAERLEHLLSRESDTVVVTDDKGVIFLSTKREWVLHTMQPLDSATRAALHASRQYGDAQLLPLPVKGEEIRADNSRLITIATKARTEAGSAAAGNGIRYLVQSAPVPYANWIIHLLSDTTPLRHRVAIEVLFAGVLMAVVVFAGGFLYQRRVILLERLEFQRRARETLEQSEANTRSIIRNTRAGLVTTDGAGNIQFCNSTAAKLFGCEAGAVTGRPFAALLAPHGQRMFAERLARDDGPQAAAATDLLETEARRADATDFPVEMAVSRMELQGTQRLLITLHDLTERKRAEEALRRAHGQLEERVRLRTADLEEANRRLQEEIAERKRAEEVLRHAQDELVQAGKLAAIGQMSAGITHELNQPLAAIRSYADNARVLIERERVSEATSNLGFILELTDRMAEITSHLKSFARKTSGTAIPVVLQHVVDQALALLSAHTKLDDVRIHRDMPATDVYVLGDRIRLEQVLLNLLNNALDAMGEKAQREIHLRVAREDGRGVLSVRDTGPGIAPDQLGQIFDPFFTTKEVGEGLGLGLSISNGIVRDYGGSIRVRNHPAGGCEFTIAIPLVAESRDQAAVGQGGAA